MPALPAELAGGRLTIDLGALADNWKTLAALGKSAECGAVVKGNGYGIGLGAAVETLLAAGCRTFFVALPEEGLKARAVAPHADIYVLGGLFEDAAPLLSDANLRPVLGSRAEVDDWARFCRVGGTPRPCAIHVDTGMNRLGLSLRDANGLGAEPELLASIKPSLLMSHFACADTPDHPLNARQIERFTDIRQLFADIPASFSNSAATLAFPQTHLDVMRPGVALYGGRALATGGNPMKPVVTLEARIIQVRDADAGDTIGYGATETVRRKSRIAILAAGYADGYLRRAGSTDERGGARVAIKGHMAPLIGRVSMDLIAVDVTDLPAGIAARGAWAELFGKTIPIDEVADHADTIGYELLTGLGQRYQRIYVGEG